MAKAGIHPNYEVATITCACGAIHETASTRGSFTVEICSKCHPFYTGKQKLMDTAGRIERFQRRYQLKPGAASVEGTSPAKPAQADVADRPEPPKAAKAESKPKPKADNEKAEGKKADDAGQAPKGDAKKPDNKKPAPAKA